MNRKIGAHQRREVEALGKELAAEKVRPFNAAAPGQYGDGSYRPRFALAPGRIAMNKNGLDFKLIARGDGGIYWGFGRDGCLGVSVRAW